MEQKMQTDRTNLNLTTSSKLNVAVLIPCLNEEKTIQKVVRDFKSVLSDAKIYVFDNNSTDKTSQYAAEAGAIVVFSAVPGKGNVVKHMFDLVEADYYVLADGDDTYPASEAPRLLDEVVSGACSMSVGSRVQKFDHESFRPLHHFGNRLVATLIRKLFRSNVTDVMSGYRVFSRELVKSLPLRSDGFEIETEMTVQAISKKFIIKEIQVKYGVRPEGSFSKLNTYQDGFLVLKSIFMIFKDYRPFFFFSSIALFLLVATIAAGIAPILDFYESHFVSHLPRAVLAAALAILTLGTFAIGLVLDTISKYHTENFLMWRRLLGKSKNGN